MLLLFTVKPVIVTFLIRCQPSLMTSMTAGHPECSARLLQIIYINKTSWNVSENLSIFTTPLKLCQTDLVNMCTMWSECIYFSWVSADFNLLSSTIPLRHR